MGSNQGFGPPESVWGPRVARALEQVRLAHRAHHLPAATSTGEQQRAAVARVLAAAPRVVFADEPTGSLESKRGAEVLELLRGTAVGGAAVLLVTHLVVETGPSLLPALSCVPTGLLASRAPMASWRFCPPGADGAVSSLRATFAEAAGPAS